MLFLPFEEGKGKTTEDKRCFKARILLSFSPNFFLWILIVSKDDLGGNER